jgi:hypothetical protein
VIFKIVLWYALLKGAKAGLKPAPPMTLSRFDDLLWRHYIVPLKLQLEQPPAVDWSSMFGETTA